VKTHIFRPVAAADIEAIFRRYERDRRGLGDEFLMEAGQTIDAVVAFPESYPAIYRDIRRALVHRFPHGLLFRIVDDVVVFVGCFHTSRDPQSWKRRR